MRFVVDILPEALSDISTAVCWYENQQAGLGCKFVAEVSRRIDELAEQALVFRIRYRRKNVRWTYPRRFPYRVCYYVDGRIVHVFAVFHAARHDREWRRRV